jgi:hypothetical protein
MLSAAGFRREFGVDYVPGLAAPGGWPPAYRRALADCDAAARRSLGAAQLRAILAALASAAPPPCRISDAGPGVGRGLFADRALSPGELIGEYAGVLTRDWEPAGRGGRFNPYLLKYPFECAYAIDAESRGNELRFANHSAKRANAERLFLELGGLLRALIISRARIEAGGQILLDYGPDYHFEKPPAELAP